MLFEWYLERSRGTSLLGQRAILDVATSVNKALLQDWGCGQEFALSVFVLSIAFACNSYSQRSCLAHWSHYSSDPRPELNTLPYCFEATRNCCFVWADRFIGLFVHLFGKCLWTVCSWLSILESTVLWHWTKNLLILSSYSREKENSKAKGIYHIRE